MDYEGYLRQGLGSQGFPVLETDIPYIQTILSTVNGAQAPLKGFPDLYKEKLITMVV